MKKQLTAIIILLCVAIVSNAQSGKRGESLSPEVLSVKVFDLTGNELTLDDVLKKYEGKVLYIDFWASWCAPCRNEMPHSKLLRQKFSQPDIEFLYFSTDETDEAWKKGVDKLGLHTNSFRLDKTTKIAIQNFFNIKGIPYYLILDRAGNIFETNASWPREENAFTELEKALNTN
ncbi:MAG TPA: hypothetical protein DCQ31_01345 [Bacteroidales bacterium]|nr:hypothetical protein [Bacteroidales bacterium]